MANKHPHPFVLKELAEKMESFTVPTNAEGTEVKSSHPALISKGNPAEQTRVPETDKKDGLLTGVGAGFDGKGLSELAMTNITM